MERCRLVIVGIGSIKLAQELGRRSEARERERRGTESDRDRGREEYERKEDEI